MNQLKYLFFWLTGAFVLAGCSKQLDLVPTDNFIEATAFRTMMDAQMGANEAYFRYGSYISPNNNVNKVVSNGAYANTMYVSGLLSDEAKIGADNAGQGALTYRYQYSADATSGGDVIALYTTYYYMIDQVNRVLANVDKVTATSIEEPRRNVLKGQMLALRAIAHFDLLQAYAKNYSTTDQKGIPYMLQYSATAQPARLSVARTVELIEKDLSDAKGLLPAVTAANFSDTVMNQLNITAYQARIALYKGDYQNAITHASTVISSNIKPLASGTNFSGIWTDATTNEILFRIRFIAGSATGSPIIGSLWTTTSGLVYFAPSDKLVASFGTGDIRRTAYIGTNAAGNNYVNKFYNSGKGGRIVDLKAARTAEMYLIRAEAYAKLATPDLAKGADDLNTLRAARITGYTPQTFTTAPALISAVLDERFKELCFEGFRFFDLKRNSLPVQRSATDANAAWQTLTANNYRFVLPIPQYELLANPNMVQNDSY